MDFGFTKEQEELRQKFHDLCEEWRKGGIEDPDYTVILNQPHSPLFYSRVAELGFFGAAYPKEYGGSELGHQAVALFQEESTYQKAPLSLSLSATTINFMGGLINDCGSEELKKKFLPRLIKGEIHIGQNFSESEASASLAHCHTLVGKRGGDYYVLNGHKLYTTFAHIAKYGMTTVKTNPKAPPGEGISLFLVDKDLPGITITPLYTITGERVNQMFFDDVKVPMEYLVGEEHKGWECLKKHMYLSWDRRLCLYVGLFRRTLEQVIEYCKKTTRNGEPLSKDPFVRQKIAQIVIELECMRLLSYRRAWAQEQQDKGIDADVIGYGAMVGVFVNSFVSRAANTLMQILGLEGQLEPGSKYTPLGGGVPRMFLMYLMRLFVSSGILYTKSFIAGHNLGLPEAFGNSRMENA